MRRSRLDYVALASGLALCVAGLAVGPLVWPLLELLPDDPEAFARALEGNTWLSRVHQALAVVVFFSAFFDASRYPTLRARRVLWRVVEMTAVLGLGVAGELFLSPARHAAVAGEDVTTRLALAYLLQLSLFATVGVASVAAHRAPGPPPIERGERYAARWIPPIFGSTPELPQRQWQVLGLMIAASFFNAYDIGIFGLALKQIQAGLAIEEGQLGFLGSAIGMGVVPGVLLALGADTWGRRRVLLVTIGGYTLFTGLTAFSPNDSTFLVFQFCARAFGAAEMVLAAVVVAEEIDKEHRGWALGVLSALALMGGGLALVLFAFVDQLPMGWRAMYLVGFGPLLILTWLRRRLPETERFERFDAGRARPTLGAALKPLVSLARVYPARFASVSSVRFLNAFAPQAAGLFLPKFLQDEHGWEPEGFALVGGVLGFVSLCSMPLMGRLSDHIGRRPVSIVAMTIVPLAIVCLYHVAGLVLIPLFWLLMSVSDAGADMNVSTFGKELFPTSYRSTADSARQLVGQVGGSLGLALESVLYTVVGSHALAISIVALPALLMPVIVAFAIPETAGRELDEISPEPAAPTGAPYA